MKSITLMLMAFSFVSTAHAYNGTVNKYATGSYCTFEKGDSLVDRECGTSGTVCNSDGSCTSAGIKGTVKRKNLREAFQQRSNSKNK
jgi:hypothetical protein